MNRDTLALGSYWTLFVVAPLAACFFIFGAGYCLPVFFALCLIGERGFRRWKRLWKVE